MFTLNRLPWQSAAAATQRNPLRTPLATANALNRDQGKLVVGQRNFSSQYQIKELNKHKLKDFVRPDDIADPLLRISTTDSYVSSWWLRLCLKENSIKIFGCILTPVVVDQTPHWKRCKGNSRDPGDFETQVYRPADRLDCA